MRREYFLQVDLVTITSLNFNHPSASRSYDVRATLDVPEYGGDSVCITLNLVKDGVFNDLSGP